MHDLGRRFFDFCCGLRPAAALLFAGGIFKTNMAEEVTLAKVGLVNSSLADFSQIVRLHNIDLLSNKVNFELQQRFNATEIVQIIYHLIPESRLPLSINEENTLRKRVGSVEEYVRKLRKNKKSLALNDFFDKPFNLNCPLKADSPRKKKLREEKRLVEAEYKFSQGAVKKLKVEMEMEGIKHNVEKENLEEKHRMELDGLQSELELMEGQRTKIGNQVRDVSNKLIT